MFLMLAANDLIGFALNASNDEEIDIEQALDDLAEGEALSKNPNYWDRIRETLLNLSASKTVEHAIGEWKRDGLVLQVPNGKCQLCGHTPILFHFPLKNKVNSNELIVGSECIFNYHQLGGQFTDLEQLRKQLKTMLNAVKKKKDLGEQGRALDDIEELYALEKKLRGFLRPILGTDDLDVKEYRDQLIEAQSIGNVLNVKNSMGFSLGLQALQACRALFRFQEDIRKRQSYQGNGIYALIDKIMMQKRDYAEQVQLLNRTLKMTSDLFKFGPPQEVHGRMWDAIDKAKDGLLGQLQGKADQAKAKMMEDYADEQSLLKPYPHLSSTLSKALASNRKYIDSQVASAVAMIASPNFLDELKANRNIPPRITNQTFSSGLGASTAPSIQAGYQVTLFCDALRKGLLWNAILKVVSATFKVEVKDLAGVRVALLRAADDGLLDCDVDGQAAISKFVMLLPHNPKIQEIIRQEVDEVKALAVVRTIRIYEQMSADLGIDVERVFKVYSADDETEKGIIATIFQKTWVAGKKLSIAQSGHIRKQLSKMSQVKEVPHSMWAYFHSQLNASFVGRKP